MNEIIKQRIIDAISQKSGDELDELITQLKKRLSLDGMVDDGMQKLRLFASVRHEVPSVYYDGGPSATIYLDDIGTDPMAFAEVMRRIDSDFRPIDARRMQLQCRRGETIRINLNISRDSDDFIEQLRAMNAVFEYEEDYIADYESVQHTALPYGLEDNLYQALMNSMHGDEQPDQMTEYAIYVYRVETESGEPYAQDESFVFDVPKTAQNGTLYWKAFTCLSKEQIHSMKRKGWINFDYSASSECYYVRLDAAPQKTFVLAKPDPRVLADEIFVKFYPDKRNSAIKYYREKTNATVSEATNAVRCIFESMGLPPE